MFLNEKCKYLCAVSLDCVCSYSCLKEHFNIHNNGCLACDDFECKFFEEDKTMTYEIKKNMDSGNYELYFNNSLIVSVNGIGPKEKLMVNRIKKLLEEK